LREPFAGRIDELTLSPVDVHPSNAGHELIAELVWTTLGFDSDPPVVDAPESLEATRSTPTLRFNATDSTRLTSVRLESSDVQWTEPLPTEDGSYLSLIDLTDLDAEDATIAIVATDMAGNTTRHDVRIVREAGGDAVD
jgi:hypothetical protein